MNLGVEKLQAGSGIKILNSLDNLVDELRGLRDRVQEKTSAVTHAETPQNGSPPCQEIREALSPIFNEMMDRIDSCKSLILQTHHTLDRVDI